MKSFEERDRSMMMDLYEMTMAYGYFKSNDMDTRVAFDVFFRKNPDQGGFSVFAGLEQVVEYIENLHFTPEDIRYFASLNLFSQDFLEYLSSFRFRGDVYSFPEGTIIYPNEPVITVVAPIIDAQLLETAVLNQVNHQSLIATKARRIVRAAAGRNVADFGGRRAHGYDAAVYGARAAVIGGVDQTATVLAAAMFGLPAVGTMAHSWVMRFRDELTAFRTYAKYYPTNCVLLADTYDVLKSGVPNAIRVFQEMKDSGLLEKGYGIRLDSGDLAYLSKEARRKLDNAGFPEAKIVVSNSLDEYRITSLLNQGACIDSFGVGERMITAKSDPVFGAVYKIAAVEEDGFFCPRIKISENIEKITNPGLKKVYRIYDGKGHAVADLLTKAEEEPDLTVPYRFIDPLKPWKSRYFTNCTAKNLQIPVIKAGKRVMEKKSLKEIAAYVNQQLTHEIWPEEQRFENPHSHYLDMSPEYYELKMSLLHL